MSHIAEDSTSKFINLLLLSQNESHQISPSFKFLFFSYIELGLYDVFKVGLLLEYILRE